MARIRSSSRARPNSKLLIQILTPALSGRHRAVERFEAGLEDRVGLSFRLRSGNSGFQPAKYM